MINPEDLVIYNPHVDDFLAEPPHFRILKRRALKKYGFFLSEAKKAGAEITVLVDATLSAAIPSSLFCKLPYFMRRIISNLEIYIWRRMNIGLDVRVIYEPAIASGKQTLLAFSYKAADDGFELRRAQISAYKRCVFHLSHYFISTENKAKNLKSLDNVVLAGDSDVTKNNYFLKYFGWYKREMLVLPFAVSSRFEPIKKWVSRKNLCVATGSFHRLKHERPFRKYKDFTDFFEFDSYHRVRRELYEAGGVPSLVDSFVSEYRPYKQKRNLFSSLVKHLFVSQKAYFSIDIAALYNEYKFALVGEELSGFPALGAFEAMASGCVLIANPKSMSGLDLTPGVHYIPYDGTLSGAINSIRNAISAGDASQAIAMNGNCFIKESCTESSVFNRWMNILDFLG